MTDESPQEWFAKVLRKPRAHELVTFPRKLEDGSEFQIAIWVLTTLESADANGEAIKAARRIIGGNDPIEQIIQTEVFKQQLTSQLLFRSCRQVGDLSKPLFRTPKDVLEYLTLDETGFLLSAYLMIQANLSPLFTSMTEQDMQDIIKRIQDGASAAPLAFFTLGALKALVIYLVSLLSTVQTSTITSESQQENDSTN